jgi:hypothetical protein
VAQPGPTPYFLPSKIQDLNSQFSKNFQQYRYFISSVFDHQNLGPGLDPDSLEMLDPDLDGSVCKVVVLDRGAGHLFDF